VAFDIRALRYFVQVAELGSLSRAARTLCVTQPSLSQQIATLEDHLGAKLFKRSHKGMALTPEGNRLLDEARGLLTSLRGIEENFRTGRARFTGHVRIGMPATVAVSMLPPLFVWARERHPRLVLHAKEAMTPVLLDGLIGGDLDLVVAAEPGEAARVSAQLMVEEALFLVGGAQSGLGDTIAFPDIVALPLITSSRSSNARTVFDAALARIGRAKLNIVLESGSLAANKRLIADHGLFALMAWSAVRHEVGQGLLTASRLIDPEVRRPLYLCRAHEREYSSSLAVVSDAIRQIVRAHAHDGAII